eukprot:12916437-Heterocapsa_arctica.AAC.1
MRPLTRAMTRAARMQEQPPEPPLQIEQLDDSKKRHPRCHSKTPRQTRNVDQGVDVGMDKGEGEGERRPKANWCDKRQRSRPRRSSGAHLNDNSEGEEPPGEAPPPLEAARH